MIAKISKAIAGAISGIVVSLLATWNLDVPADAVTWLDQLIYAGVAALLGFAGVWISPKNAE